MCLSPTAAMVCMLFVMCDLHYTAQHRPGELQQFFDSTKGKVSLLTLIHYVCWRWAFHACEIPISKYITQIVLKEMRGYEVLNN